MKPIKYLRAIFSWIFLIALSVCIHATRVYSDKTTAALDKYQTLVGTLQKTMPEKVKEFPFLRLRRAFFETGRDSSYGNLKKEVRQALSKEDYNFVVEQTEKFLGQNFTASWAHTMKAYSHEKLKEKKQGAFHRNVARGLTNSVFDSGDGKSPATAWKVLNVDEEYELLAEVFRIFKIEKQDLVEEKGRFYDALTANSKDGARVQYYFDITEHYNRQCVKLTGKACT